MTNAYAQVGSRTGSNFSSPDVYHPGGDVTDFQQGLSTDAGTSQEDHKPSPGLIIIENRRANIVSWISQLGDFTTPTRVRFISMTLYR